MGVVTFLPITSYKMLPNKDYSSCANKGIYTAAQYMDKYASEETRGDVPIVVVDVKACSFSPSNPGFKTSMELSKYLQKDIPKKTCIEYAFTGNGDGCWTNNELIVSSWPKETVDVSRVPIKAFFVLINGGNSYPNSNLQESLRVAFKKAADYSEATHQSRQIPVVTIDISKIKNGENDVFAIAPSMKN
jgi:hypothetical protein